MSSTRKTLIALTAAVAMAVGGGQVLVSTVCACSAPPESQFAPVVTGATTIGQTLSTSNGTWVASGNLAGHPNTSYAYQWQRCNSSGASCVDIAAATASTHTVVAGDVGYTLRAVVTATNNGGSTDANSNVTDPITGNLASLLFGKQTVGGTLNGGLSADAKRVIRVTPTSSGDVVKLSEYFAPTGTVGTQSIRGVLYANTTSACPVGETDCPGTRLGISDPITFANTNSAGWYDLVFPDSPPVTADGTYWLGNISGSTAAIAQYAYDTAGSNVRDLNANIYTDGPANPFGAVTTTDAQEFSAYGTIADSGSPINSAAPTVSDQTSAGRWQVGDNAAFAAGTWSPTGSITQRWQRCTGILCANIAGATASTYTLTAADVASTIRAVVTESNATGATSAASAVSGVVVTGGTSPAIWTGTFDTTKTGGFQACPNIPRAPGNFPSSSGGLNSTPGTTYTYGSWVDTHVTCVADPLGSGATVAKYAIPDADRPPNGNGTPRADLESPWTLDTGVHWISTSELLPADTPVPPSDGVHSGTMLWEVYGYPYAGSPPTSMAWSPRTDDLSHDYFYLGGAEGSNNYKYWQAPKNSTGSVGAWHSFIIRLDSETGTNNGSMELWYDEVRQSFTNCAIGSCTTDGAAANDILHYTTLNSTNWDNHVHADTDQFLDLNQYRPPCAEFPAEWNYCGTVTSYQGAPAFGDSFAAVAATLTTPSGP